VAVTGEPRVSVVEASAVLQFAPRREPGGAEASNDRDDKTHPSERARAQEGHDAGDGQENTASAAAVMVSTVG
jgi:hypothetical protein